VVTGGDVYILPARLRVQSAYVRGKESRAGGPVYVVGVQDTGEVEWAGG